MSDEPIFEGFERPTRNYFPMPNEWIDICSRIKSLAEIKVIFYILRHTWGYQEYGITKVISFDEFMSGRKRSDGSRIDSGTGLSRQSVIDGLNLAVKHGYIICEVDASDLARVKKSYALKMRSGVKNLDPQISSLNSIPQGSNIYTSEVKEVDSRGLNSTPRSEKDTIEKHLGNTPIEKQGTVTSASAESDAPANVYHFEEEKKRITNGRIPAVSGSQSTIGNDDFADRPTEKRPVVKPSQQMPAVGTRSLAVGPQTGSQDDSPNVQASLPHDAARAVSTPPASVPGTSASGAVQASIPKRPRGKVTQATLKSPEELEQDERCRALQQRINEWRGYDLKGESKGKIINEHKSIRTLVETYTDEQIEQIYLYLFNRHWRWSKPDSRYNIGAYVILSEAKGVMMELKARPKQNGKAPSKPDAYGNDYSLTSLIARQQKAM